MDNILAHWNGFVARRRIVPLGTAELVLYYVLLEYCNALGRPGWFSVTAGVLQGLSGLSASAFQRARKALCAKGYIEVRRGCGNRAGGYHMVACCESRCQQGLGGDGAPAAKGKPADKAATLKKEKERVKEKEKEPPHPLAGALGWEEWRDYAQMRLKIDRPLGPRAERMALDRLQQLAPGDGAAQRAILNQSTFYCWKDLYPLPPKDGRAGCGGAAGEGGAASGGPPPGPDMNELAVRSARQRAEKRRRRG